MKSFTFHTTNKARALEMVAKIRAAGYTFRKHPRNAGTHLEPMTFSTATYTQPNGARVYYMAWAYSSRAPLPPRRKLGRSICKECGKRRVKTRGLCAACAFREKYARDPEFRERKLAKTRRKMAQLYQLPEWRAKRARYQAEWAKRKRAKVREMGVAA